MPESTVVAGPVRADCDDVADRLARGLGEVAGEQLDRAGEHEPDEHRDEGDDLRIALRVEDRAAGELAELARQVGEADDRRADDRDPGADEEAAVDRRQAAAVGLARAGGEDADHRGDDADHGDRQREDQALRAEDLLAEDQRGDERDGVGLEEVGRHTGAVTDVVTDVVGDGGGVTRVVLRDTGLDLADQVGADVGSLGEDAAADTHEHGEQGGAEAEALQHLRRVLTEDDHDQRGTRAGRGRP